MSPKARIACFAALLMMLVIAGFAHAQAVNPVRSQNNDFEAQCEDLKSKYTCRATFYEDNVEIWCSTRPADLKEQPVSPQMSVMYKCRPEKQGSTEVWVCKYGFSPKTMATFTREEFKDTQTRCTRLCSSCPQGWK